MISTITRLTILAAMVAIAPSLLALTPNLPAGSLLPGMVVQTRLGPMNCILEAPRPRIVPFRGVARGVYAADINVATGDVYSVRVLQTSGNSALDNTILDALQGWRFRPRIIYKLVVPVDFKGSTVSFGAR